MSTPAIRAISGRAGGALARNTTAQPSYGRTAAYRRIASQLRTYSEASVRARQDGASSILPPFALRSHFLPPSISASRAGSVRHVSFKEMREQRLREKAAGQAEKPAGKAEVKPAAAAAEPEPAKATEPEETEADKVFARFQAEAEAAYAKQQKAEAKQREAEEKAKAKAEAGEGEAEEGAEGEQKEKKKEEEAAPPKHGNKTPWQVFTETLQAEFKASKDWQEGTKQLSGTMHDFTQNPNVQRARSAYAKAAETASTTTGKVFLGTAGAIGKGAAWTWDTLPARAARSAAAAVGSGVEKATRPVRETEAYKSVKETIDDGSSQRYGGWTEKEERRKKREERDRKMGSTSKAPEVYEENPEAGTNVTVHKDSAWKEAWKNMRENNPAMQRLFKMGDTYRESENPLISTARSVTDRIAGFFAENETAMVIKKFREMDPSFQLEPFLNEMRSYILPEVLEAYVKGDVETLKLWLSAAQFQVYHALMQQYTTAGLKSDGKILDIRGVDILSARILDPGEIPVFVLMCRTQEVHVYRNKKSGELAAGMEDKVQQVTYAIGVTRIPEEVSNPETRGWRLIELQKSARDYV
ncbi:Mitochondrial import inner membrane translocase subunit tim44 [Fulvia fulva]|uniref:Mitochondrial import inner membrane translocase subunit TIM44 n=1 Tax=Passalora fulva TaxID=5499 RepID=A0A9Q8L886_PASFU|nr:Mitochondrial import inner membrane translocase subunit tim44 [Fulvia fulva]KAK4634861.1 Mitochondrial import inner membrane translocase subunit tim44 [Fulvia fulva]KAK4637455.1 Mitochondrial import inner membrane translocase subunit tim44 [Fulvia fulva]UJO12726.1 Mitochondrial import inner membrane translocase subunit tim44 [Fulvia fulva]WPV10380.1 Mitochondrial import inner membrane translocase subunit tim44 [Fulvia fulva]WPV23852.1 Mitochondrial import inner membrane translocase subunit 